MRYQALFWDENEERYHKMWCCKGLSTLYPIEMPFNAFANRADPD